MLRVSNERIDALRRKTASAARTIAVDVDDLRLLFEVIDSLSGLAERELAELEIDEDGEFDPTDADLEQLEEELGLDDVLGEDDD